jgi:hypothetical protein
LQLSPFMRRGIEIQQKDELSEPSSIFIKLVEKKRIRCRFPWFGGAGPRTYTITTDNGTYHCPAEGNEIVKRMKRELLFTRIIDRRSERQEIQQKQRYQKAKPGFPHNPTSPAIPGSFSTEVISNHSVQA